jgi:uncharacterized membrane protein YsdA (DUF1294 family)
MVRSRTWFSHVIVGALLAGATALAVELLTPIGWLGGWFLAINGVALGYYGLDKRAARRQQLRVPEHALHVLALLGGSAGALLGQRLFRHKTAKPSFQVVFWTIAIAQLVLLCWWFWPR